MSATLYAFSAPLLTRGLSILSIYMDKAIEHAATHGLDEDVLFSARLAPDMQPLSSQVQMAGDKAKNGVSRLVGITPPAYPDTETTFDQLKTRLAKTIDFIGTITPAQFEGSGEREVELRFKGSNLVMTGHDYLTKGLLPDFYFHLASAHGILRHNGLAIGKADYLGTVG